MWHRHMQFNYINHLRKECNDVSYYNTDFDMLSEISQFKKKRKKKNGQEKAYKDSGTWLPRS